MAANRLPLPLKPRRAAPQGAQGAAPPRNAAEIESDRNRLVTKLMRMRKSKVDASADSKACADPARPLQTALILLTSKWAEANWRARERLIKAADWMIRLESRRGA